MITGIPGLDFYLMESDILAKRVTRLAREEFESGEEFQGLDYYFAEAGVDPSDLEDGDYARTRTYIRELFGE